MPSQNISTIRAPLSDVIITAVSRLVDDAQSETRDPSHSDIEFCINRTNLQNGDPKAHGQPVGKAKRVRNLLYWAVDNAPEAGEVFVARLVALIRGCGGFRSNSPNYVGIDCIDDAIEAFKTEGYELTNDGELSPTVLENLSGAELTQALESYIRRARKGVIDAALLTGTSKDLLEATAAHVLQELWGAHSERDNFPTLLGQAFIAVGMATTQDKPKPDESPQRRLERVMYDLGLVINNLRNKQGTGHGRPWLPSISISDARMATELMGIIAERLILGYKNLK